MKLVFSMPSVTLVTYASGIYYIVGKINSSATMSISRQKLVSGFSLLVQDKENRMRAFEIAGAKGSQENAASDVSGF